MTGGQAGLYPKILSLALPLCNYSFHNRRPRGLPGNITVEPLENLLDLNRASSAGGTACHAMAAPATSATSTCPPISSSSNNSR